MKKVLFTAQDIKKYDISGIDQSDPLKVKLELELNNGAKCNLDERILSCTYSAKNHETPHQHVENPNENDEFIDKIELKGIRLQEIPQTKRFEDNQVKYSLDKLAFALDDDFQVQYRAQYPNSLGTCRRSKSYYCKHR